MYACTFNTKSVDSVAILRHTILKVDLTRYTPFSRNVPTHDCLYGKHANGQMIRGYICTCDIGIDSGIRANTTV